MKIKDYKCKCGHDDFFFAEKRNNMGIYCSYCGKWFKWADKDEKNLAMNCVTKIRNDLIKNGDDLIKRQDAIDACFNGKVANNYDCAEAIEKLPSAMGKGEWSVRVTPSTLGYFEYTCSECGKKAYEATKYCGHCGSYMWGRKE